RLACRTRPTMSDATQRSRLGEASPPRVVIESVTPEVDAGCFPAKRALGDTVVVAANVFTEGHDRLAAVMRFRGPGDGSWREVRMTACPNDRFEATVTVD